ncbi:hypothetical protein GSI_04841 [Ganoderma sinense ZZ0214-1]|uniref:F-box domain-containing protein n=1 Tax=Ganoderma sinense ZZ0214-1 TaxID=1077348 RepID=A0A2G8SG35_9APHY|nr:hypothetical protein GSI_04841 [Ganoderma sinense ZZ0214-1]
MSATLPNELIDRTIDYLHDDPETLSACALVRTSWVPAVRYHRFGRVRLQQHKVIPFHALLQTSPDVASFVRHLIMFGVWSPVQSMAVLHDMFSSFIKLRVLSLCYFSLEPSEARDLFSTLPKSLESVKMDGIALPTVGDLVLLWSQLPRLRTFVLCGRTKISTAEIPEEYMRDGGKVFRATEIQLLWQIPHFDVIADWLCSHNVPPQLRVCSMTVSRAEYIAPATKLLRGVGPALLGLELHLSNGEGTVVQDLDDERYGRIGK